MKLQFALITLSAFGALAASDSSSSFDISSAKVSDQEKDACVGALMKIASCASKNFKCAMDDSKCMCSHTNAIYDKCYSPENTKGCSAAQIGREEALKQSKQSCAALGFETDSDSNSDGQNSASHVALGGLGIVSSIFALLL